MFGFALNSRTYTARKLPEWFNCYQQLFVLDLVRPDTSNDSADEHHGGNPALVAVDALVVFRAQQMILFAMGQQVRIEVRQETNAAFTSTVAIQVCSILTQQETTFVAPRDFNHLGF